MYLKSGFISNSDKHHIRGRKFKFKYDHLSPLTQNPLYCVEVVAIMVHEGWEPSKELVQQTPKCPQV